MAKISNNEGSNMELDRDASYQATKFTERTERPRSSCSRIFRERFHQGNEASTMLYISNFLSLKARWIQTPNSGFKSSKFVPQHTPVQNFKSCHAEKNPSGGSIHDQNRHKGRLLTYPYSNSFTKVFSFHSQPENLYIPSSTIWSSTGAICVHSNSKVSYPFTEKKRCSNPSLPRRFDCMASRQRNLSRTYKSYHPNSGKGRIFNKHPEVLYYPIQASNLVGSSLVWGYPFYWADPRLSQGIDRYGYKFATTRENFQEGAGKTNGEDSLCRANSSLSSLEQPLSCSLPETDTNQRTVLSPRDNQDIQSSEVLDKNRELERNIQMPNSTPNADIMDGCLEQGIRSHNIEESNHPGPLDDSRSSLAHKCKGVDGRSTSCILQDSQTQNLVSASHRQHNHNVRNQESGLQLVSRTTECVQVSLTFSLFGYFKV